jgi:hypothetical protein
MIRGTVYFVLVFAVGFVLGTIRVLWLVPQLGERSAELLEAPAMLTAIVLAARFVTRKFPATRSADYLRSGGIALVLLLTVEFTVVLGLRGLTVSEYLTERDPIAGSVYIVMLLLFAAIPWLIGKRQGSK